MTDLFTPRLFGTEKRYRMRLSPEDMKAWDEQQGDAKRTRMETGNVVWIGPLTDLDSGRTFKATPAKCRAACYCDAEFKFCSAQARPEFPR